MPSRMGAIYEAENTLGARQFGQRPHGQHLAGSNDHVGKCDQPRALCNGVRKGFDELGVAAATEGKIDELEQNAVAFDALPQDRKV